MTAVAPLQMSTAKPVRTTTAGLLLQRKCACGASSASVGEKCENCQSTNLQRKLSIGSSNDVFELEADRIADQVLDDGRHSHVGATPLRIQRLRGQPRHELSSAPASVERVLASSGRCLDPALRNDMEQRFGYDFSSVRVHSDAAAERSARSVDASAYTVGHRIVFGAGCFAPATRDGRRLIAHELTHVVQQSSVNRSKVIQSSGKSELSPLSRADNRMQRKPRAHPRDRCAAVQGSGSLCADWSTAPTKARISRYLEHAPAHLDNFDLGLMVLGAIITASVTPVERAQLLRIASCQLEPDAAAFVREAFVERSGNAGQFFGNLSTPTRCSLLSILDERADAAGRAQGLEVRNTINDDFARIEDQQQARVRRDAAAEQHWKKDLALQEKAGRTTWFDVVFPSAARRYRIPYAAQIQNPVLRMAAVTAERAATVSIAGAVADPITRPLIAVLKFIECLVSSMKGKDLKAVADRFGLKLALSIPVFFPLGVSAGAATEIGQIAKQVVSIISDPLTFLSELEKFIKLFWSPQSEELACAMGEDLGEELNAKVASLAKLSGAELAYQLGYIAGPLLLNTLLAIVAPELVAGLKGTRVGKRLLAVLDEMRDNLKFVEKGRSQRPMHKSVSSPEIDGGGGRTTTVIETPAAGGHTVRIKKGGVVEYCSEPCVNIALVFRETLEQNADLAKTFKSLQSQAQQAEKMIASADPKLVKQGEKLVREAGAEAERLQSTLAKAGIRKDGVRYRPEPDLLGEGRHGVNWDPSDAKERALRTGDPQGKFGGVEDIQYAVDQAVRLGPGKHDIFNLPPGNRSRVFMPNGDVPATRVFVMVRQNGSVHAYPLP